MQAPLPANEAERLDALREYHILDSAAEQSYDSITRLVSYICDVPMATVSLVDESRQWFKSSIGIEENQTPRNVAFCAHAILNPEPMIVADALLDHRFAENPLVRSAPFVRFYAGFPLTTPEGLSLGALCAIDRRPRSLSRDQGVAMQALARQVMELLELRRVSAHLAHALDHVKTLQSLLPVCAWCKRVRDDAGYWLQIETYLHAHIGADFTHGICPNCLEKLQPFDTDRPRPASPADDGLRLESGAGT